MKLFPILVYGTAIQIYLSIYIYLYIYQGQEGMISTLTRVKIK